MDGSDYVCSSNPCKVGRCISAQVSGGYSYICKCAQGISDPECYNSSTSFQGMKLKCLTT